MTTATVRGARDLARALLTGDRWHHSAGVARRAQELTRTVPRDDREILLVAAWLHDVGHSPFVAVTGFHGLDGADYLTRHGWPPRVSALVAHHSGAWFVADATGMRGALDAYAREQSAVADALTYADQTTDQHGAPMTIQERLADMVVRHGPDSVQARVHHEREPYLLAVAGRVEARLHRSPVDAAADNTGRTMSSDWTAGDRRDDVC